MGEASLLKRLLRGRSHQPDRAGALPNFRHMRLIHSCDAWPKLTRSSSGFDPMAVCSPANARKPAAAGAEMPLLDPDVRVSWADYLQRPALEGSSQERELVLQVPGVTIGVAVSPPSSLFDLPTGERRRCSGPGLPRRGKGHRSSA
jgi:hypothetical protein